LVQIQTIQHIWDDARRCLNEGVPVDVRSKRYKCGQTKKDVNVSVLKDLPLSKCTTIDDVAKKMGVSKNKAHKLKKKVP
jgi:hypothetical protein